MDVFAQKRLKFSGSLVDQRTVRFGSVLFQDSAVYEGNDKTSL